MKIGKQKIKIPNSSRLKIAIILPHFNEKLGKKLLKNAEIELKKNSVRKIDVFHVKGALELPYACQKLAKRRKHNGIIALGIIIKGETKHFDLVCENTYRGLMLAQMETKIPISFGIITAKTEKQAVERLNMGIDAAKAILLQIHL